MEGWGQDSLGLQPEQEQAMLERRAFQGNPGSRRGLKIAWSCEHRRFSAIPSCLHTLVQTGVCDLGYEHAWSLGQDSRSLLKIRVDSQAVCPELALRLLGPSLEKRKLLRKNIRPHTSPSKAIRKPTSLGSGGRRQRTLEG